MYPFDIFVTVEFHSQMTHVIKSRLTMVLDHSHI